MDKYKAEHPISNALTPEPVEDNYWYGFGTFLHCVGFLGIVLLVITTLMLVETVKENKDLVEKINRLHIGAAMAGNESAPWETCGYCIGNGWIVKEEHVTCPVCNGKKITGVSLSQRDRDSSIPVTVAPPLLDTGILEPHGTLKPENPKLITPKEGHYGLFGVPMLEPTPGEELKGPE